MNMMITEMRSNQTSQISTLSIVVPIFRPGPELFPYLNGLVEAFGPARVELILVCDGLSASHHLDALGNYSAPSNCTFLRLDLRTNCGQQRATWHGMQRSKSELIMTVDEDGQHQVESAVRLVHAAKSNNDDLVVGTYIDGGRSRFRESFSRLYHSFTKKSRSTEKRSSLRVVTRSYVHSLGDLTRSELLLGPILWENTDYKSTITTGLSKGHRPTTYRSQKTIQLGMMQLSAASKMTFTKALAISLTLSILSFLATILILISKIFGMPYLPGFASQFSLQLLTFSLISSAFSVIFVMLDWIVSELNKTRVTERLHETGEQTSK